jgi:hypothetical protein
MAPKVECPDVGKDEFKTSFNGVEIQESFKIEAGDLKGKLDSLIAKKNINVTSLQLKLEGTSLKFTSTCGKGDDIVIIDEFNADFMSAKHFHDFNVNEVLVVNYINMFIDRMTLCEGLEDRAKLKGKFTSHIKSLGTGIATTDAHKTDKVYDSHNIPDGDIQGFLDKIKNALGTWTLYNNLASTDKASIDTLLTKPNSKGGMNVHCLTLIIYVNYILSRIILLVFSGTTKYELKFGPKDEGTLIMNKIFGTHAELAVKQEQAKRTLNPSSTLKTQLSIKAAAHKDATPS